MEGDWGVYPLEECMEAIIDYRGKTPKKTDSGVPLITAKIVKKGRILPVTEFIAESDYDAWMRRGIPKSGDIVMTTEAPLGEIAQLDEGKVALAQRVITLRGKKDFLDNRFLKYLMISQYVQHQLEGRGTGTTVKGIKQSELRQIQLKIPSLSTQKAIAHILASLDDKIELNYKINQTLEEIAQAIFKSWFVYFDPVNAKKNSVSEDELDKAARELGISREALDLFPSEFEESELGLIPKGWNVRELGSLIKQRNERVAASEATQNLPYIPIDCIDSKSLLLSKEKSGKEAQSSLIKFYKGDILFGAMRPYFHKVCVSPFEGTTRTTVFVLNSRETSDYGFALLSLHQESTVSYATRHSTGTTIPYAKWAGVLERMPIVIPQKELRERYQDIVGPLLSKILSTHGEQATLHKTRNTLLPKLLSGELDVSNIELELAND